MSIVYVEELVRLFIKNPLSHIPIADKNQKGDLFVVGFLSRDKVFHFSVDKNRLEKNFDCIPDFFISKEILPETIWEFFNQSPIPLINIYGKLEGSWNRSEINFHLKNFLYTMNLSQKRIDIKNDEGTDILQKYYLIESILSVIPYPLMATNIKGQHIFYNEDFIKQILEKGPFKKKMALAESYFIEITQKTLANHILNNRYSDTMEFYLTEMNKKVLIRNLTKDYEVFGYLYIFIDDTKKSTNLLEEVDKNLKNGLTYDAILKNIEKEVIEFYLKKHDQNITHASKELRIKRTTLQNKLKRFMSDEIKEDSDKEEKKDDKISEKVEIKHLHSQSRSTKKRKSKK